MGVLGPLVPCLLEDAKWVCIGPSQTCLMCFDRSRESFTESDGSDDGLLAAVGERVSVNFELAVLASADVTSGPTFDAPDAAAGKIGFGLLV